MSKRGSCSNTIAAPDEMLFCKCLKVWCMSLSDRWKVDAKGVKVHHSVSKQPILQFVSIKRKDCGEWAIPGVSGLYISFVNTICCFASLCHSALLFCAYHDMLTATQEWLGTRKINSRTSHGHIWGVFGMSAVKDLLLTSLCVFTRLCRRGWWIQESRFLSRCSGSSQKKRWTRF